MMTGIECGEVSELDADETSVGPDGKTFTFRKMGEIIVCGAKNGDSGGPPLQETQGLRDSFKHTRRPVF